MTRCTSRMPGRSGRGRPKPWAASATRRAARWDSRTLVAPSVIRREQVLLVRVDGCLDPRVQVELLEDVADVVLHGVLGDDEVVSDLAVGQPARHQAQHLDLA